MWEEMLMATPGMKRRLQSNEVLAGYVNIIPSAVSVHAMIAATAGMPCAPLVRVPRRDEAWVKPALDLGAEGVVFPLVRTAEDAAECVALTRYPPRGRRGWGPFVAHARWGVGLADYLPRRGEETVCVLLIETRAAVENIEAICRV